MSIFSKLLDFNDPFYKPLWLRIAVVAVAAGWGIFEYISGSPFWGVIFVGAAAFAFYGFFISFNPRAPEQKKGTEQDDA